VDAARRDQRAGVFIHVIARYIEGKLELSAGSSRGALEEIADFTMSYSMCNGV
jgi:hypothetical protein